MTVPLVTLEAVLAAISAHDGDEPLELAVAESLFDPAGMYLAIITDRALGHDLWPVGVVAHEGYRLVRYRREAPSR